MNLLKYDVYKYVRDEISRGWWRNWILPLEEIGGGCTWRYDALRVRDSTEQLGLSPVDILEDHDWGNVSTAVAVVGRWPHGHQLFIKHELVALMDKLVSTADELQVVDMNELKGNINIIFM